MKKRDKQNPEYVEAALYAHNNWAMNPGRFVQEVLFDPKQQGLKLSTQQLEGYRHLGNLVRTKLKMKNGEELTKEEEYYRDKVGISIQSGKGTGKDMWAAGAILWFLTFFDDSLVPCTGPSSEQLQNVLWREIATWLSGSLIEDQIGHQSTRIYRKDSDGKKNYAMPRTANPNSSPEALAKTLAGLHAPHMMIVIDEADGVPEPVFRELDSTMTDVCNFAVLIYNPTRSTGFAIESQKSDKYIALHWDAEESENVDAESIKYKRDTYGIDSNYYRVYVKGLPPQSEQDALIPWSWILEARGREIEAENTDPLIFGVDVGAGGDKSVICKRKGGVVKRPMRNSSPDTMQIANWVATEVWEDSPAAIHVDIIGVGNGVYYKLRELNCRNVFPLDVRRASTSTNPRFERLRDELWWRVRQQFEQGTISIPEDDPELMGELSILKYEEQPSGKIKVSGKREMRREGHSSPDLADALMHTFSMPDSAFRHMTHEPDAYERALMEEDKSGLTFMSV